MFKKTIACLLTLATVFTGVAAIATPAEAAKKMAAPTITGNAGFVASDNDSVGLHFTWKKVKGAKGYQYRYNCFFEKGTTKAADFTKGTTKKKAIDVGFQDHTNIRFQVRAFKKVNGKNVFGKWATVDITEKQVEALIAQANMVDLRGDWQDTVSQRATMNIEFIGSGEDGAILAIVSWSSSATENSCWQLPGKFDQDTGVFTFEDGKRIDTVFDDKGNEVSSNVVKEKITGTMKYDSEKGTLTWEDPDQGTLIFEKTK